MATKTKMIPDLSDETDESLTGERGKAQSSHLGAFT